MSEIAKTDQGHGGLVTQIERIAGDPNIDIAKLETLWKMQEKAQDRVAKMAYNADMASMQSEMPIVPKSGEIKVNNVVRSKYVLFEDIIKAIQPLLDKYGFSVSFKTDFHEASMQIHGVISHSQGHEEKTTMSLPFDGSGSKNAVQAIGSSVSYGKRYCLCMLLNIAASGEDDDGHGTTEDELKKATLAGKKLVAMGIAIRNHLTSIAYIKENIYEGEIALAAEAFFEIPTEDQEVLLIAPTKGGPFETSEVKIIREQFSSAIRQKRDEDARSNNDTK